MGPLIQQALFYGYNALQVMQFLGKKFPKLQQGFQQAQQAGHSPDQILSFLNSANVLSNRFRIKDKEKQEKTNSHFEDELEAYGIKKKKRLKKVGSFLGEAASFAPSMAAMGYLGYQLYKNRSPTSPATGSAPPQPIGTVQDNFPQEETLPQSAPPVEQNQPVPPQSPPAQPIAQGAAGQTDPTGGPLSPKGPVTPLLKELGMHNILSGMRDNPPELVSKAMRQLYGSRVQEAESKLQRPLDQIINEFYNEEALHSNPEKDMGQSGMGMEEAQPLEEAAEEGAQQAPEIPRPIESPLQQNRSPAKPQDFVPTGPRPPIPPSAPRPPIAPRKVLLGDKVGTVKSVRGDIAKVDVEGKERHVKVSDLEEEPEDIAAIDESHLDKLLDHMLEVIPKKNRSAALSFVMYDPETQTMDVEYLSSPEKGHRYYNIPQEKIDEIGVARAVTTGENLAGAWQAGIADSYNAALTAIRRDKEKYPFKVIQKAYDWMLPLKKHYAKRLKEESRSKRKGDGKQKRAKP